MTGYTVATYDTMPAAKTALAALSNNNEVHFTAVREGVLTKFVIVYRPKIVLEPIALTDSDGTNTVCTLVEEIGETPIGGTGIYALALTDPLTGIMWLDYDGSDSFILAKVGIITDCADTVSIKFVYAPLTSTVDAGADAENYGTDTNLVLDATQGAKWTYIVFNIPFAGVPVGISFTLGATGNVYAQALKEA